jgi:hypothetical protein
MVRKELVYKSLKEYFSPAETDKPKESRDG